MRLTVFDTSVNAFCVETAKQAVLNTRIYLFEGLFLLPAKLNEIARFVTFVLEFHMNSI